MPPADPLIRLDIAARFPARTPVEPARLAFAGPGGTLTVHADAPGAALMARLTGPGELRHPGVKLYGVGTFFALGLVTHEPPADAPKANVFGEGLKAYPWVGCDVHASEAARLVNRLAQIGCRVECSDRELCDLPRRFRDGHDARGLRPATAADVLRAVGGSDGG